jgi:hypothetical protein
VGTTPRAVCRESTNRREKDGGKSDCRSSLHQEASSGRGDCGAPAQSESDKQTEISERTALANRKKDIRSRVLSKSRRQSKNNPCGRIHAPRNFILKTAHIIFIKATTPCRLFDNIIDRALLPLFKSERTGV